MQSIPQDEVGSAESQNDPSGLASGGDRQPAQLPQTGDAHQHEQAGERPNVMRIEKRIEIRLQREEQQRQRDPYKAVFAQRQKKERNNQVQRREKEEADVAD